ncbi:MAG: DUF177 domain-containing protein [Candidatus Omnitrophica bacterium]|nr:DUF177 domain-containing protein [Candidatus Omnitrophota bacterium]
MKIKVEKISDKVIEVEEEIPASSWGMDSSELTFVNSICLKYKFFRAGEEIRVETLATTQREIICSRCLDQVRQTNQQSFKNTYKISELGDCLEVDRDIRENILLNLPLKVLCREDCKGICPLCGVNLNNQECNCQMKPGLTERSEHKSAG